MAGRPVAANKQTQQRSGHRLDITVWQFVRIMVQLEAVAKSRGGRRRAGQTAPPQERPVFIDWRAAWQEIDRELVRLAANDADAFAELMMNQNVILECRNRSQINEVARAIDNVVHQMRAEVAASAGDDQHITDLRFEIRELEKLAKKLSGVGRKKVTKPAAAKAGDTMQTRPASETASKAGRKPHTNPGMKPARRPGAKAAPKRHPRPPGGAPTARTGSRPAGEGGAGKPTRKPSRSGPGRPAKPSGERPRSAPGGAGKPAGGRGKPDRSRPPR
jgi:hypothetical protein